MSDVTLTKIRFRNGIWEGRLSGAQADRPSVEVLYLDRPLDGVELGASDAPGEWELKVPIPSMAVADGVHAFLITDGKGSKLGAFALAAGEDASSGLHAEVELLRAELDMLKRAFRRHCLETM